MADPTVPVAVTGVEAVAHGLRDGGVTFTTAYPGFHAHEMAALLGCTHFSVNEKNALAVAWGASLAGVRAAALFKNVGLNDAADPYVNACVLGVHGGLVVVVTDDVDVEQSQLRQDSRPYADFPGSLWLEPRSVQDAYDLARLASNLSERLGTLVVLRVTNLLAHASGQIGRHPSTSPRHPFRRDPERWVVHPVNAEGQLRRLIDRQETVARWVDSAYDPPKVLAGNPVRVTVGLAGSLTDVPGDLQVFTLPLPRPWLRALAGWGSVRVEEHGVAYVAGKIAQARGSDQVQSHLVHSPRSVHAYRNFDRYEPLYAVLRSVKNRVVVGDLGGHTMDPARTVDACLCFGCSIGVATGLAVADGDLRVFCVTGDTAFLHSGKPALAEAQAREVPITILLFDNGGSQGTGGHGVPGSVGPDGFDLEWHTLTISDLRCDFLTSLLKAPPGHRPKVIHLHIPF